MTLPRKSEAVSKATETVSNANSLSYRRAGESRSRSWSTLWIGGAAALLLFAGPELVSAKEKRSAESTRPSSGATATRPATQSSSTGSSSSGTSGRTRVGSSRSEGSSNRSGAQSGRATAQPRTGTRSSGTVRSTASGHRTATSSSTTGRHRHPHRSAKSYERYPYRYRGHYDYRYVPYYGWVYGVDWAFDSYWSRYYRPFWGGWWGSYWDWFFYTGYTPRSTRAVARSGGFATRSGALDLDVSPEEAEVWIDGEYLGQADDYDGFPEYLWLPAGEVTVTFFLEGYETLTRDYNLRPGDVRRVRDKLRPGESIHPRDLYVDREPVRGPQPKPYSGASTYREDREVRNSERRGEAERRRAETEAWRDREPRAEREERRRESSHRLESSDGVGRLYLSVVPDDASVYLDGVFLGLARELSGLSAGLVVAPGDHVLEVVRPGFEDDSHDFSIEEDESIELSIELDDD